MPFIEKIITAGNMVEIKRYFSSRLGIHDPRADKENLTPAAAEKINEKNAKNKLEMLVHANFTGGVDYFVTLTYDKLDNRRDWAKNPATLEEIKWVKSEGSKFMRKLRTAYRRIGIEPAYIKVTEIRDEDGVGVRPHHHLFLNKSSMDMIAKLWPHGRVTTSILDMDYQRLSELVSYFVKQRLTPEERQIISKRWDSSKKLKTPDIDTVEIKNVNVSRPPKEVVGVEKGLKKYQGYKIIEWENAYYDTIGPYQRVKMIKISEPTTVTKKQSSKKANKKRRC